MINHIKCKEEIQRNKSRLRPGVQRSLNLMHQGQKCITGIILKKIQIKYLTEIYLNSRSWKDV